MSPKEFNALWKHFRGRDEMWDRRIATLLTYYYNWNRGDAPSISVDDFLGKPKKSKLPERNDVLLEKSLEAMFGVGPSKPQKEIQKP